MWDCIQALTPMKPGTRLTKEQSNPSPDPAFHRRYRGIVGSLGYLVNMTRPDLAWSYSELGAFRNGGASADVSRGGGRKLQGCTPPQVIQEEAENPSEILIIEDISGPL